MITRMGCSNGAGVSGARSGSDGGCIGAGQAVMSTRPSGAVAGSRSDDLKSSVMICVVLFAKIVLCNVPTSDIYKIGRGGNMQDLGAAGSIFASDEERSKIDFYVSFPATVISAKAASDIYAYINSTKNPVSTILPSITFEKSKPALVVAYFSSSGPCIETSNIMNTHIAAPGVNMLASRILTNSTSDFPTVHKRSAFNLESGTSMAYPHVTGVAAAVKYWNPS